MPLVVESQSYAVSFNLQCTAEGQPQGRSHNEKVFVDSAEDAVEEEKNEWEECE